MVLKNINKPKAFFVLTKDGVGFCAFWSNTLIRKIDFDSQPTYVYLYNYKGAQ